MIVYPIRSNLAKPGDAIPELFSKALARNGIRVESKDIVAVSSKIVGISENRTRSLDSVKPGSRARTLARKHSLTPPFAQAVIDEADRVIGGVKGALLTVKNGDAVANAGIDRKNAPEGAVVIWPRNADLSAVKIRQSIRRRSGKNVGVVIVDSQRRPRPFRQTNRDHVPSDRRWSSSICSACDGRGVGPDSLRDCSRCPC